MSVTIPAAHILESSGSGGTSGGTADSTSISGGKSSGSGSGSSSPVRSANSGGSGGSGTGLGSATAVTRATLVFAPLPMERVQSKMGLSALVSGATQVQQDQLLVSSFSAASSMLKSGSAASPSEAPVLGNVASGTTDAVAPAPATTAAASSSSVSSTGLSSSTAYASNAVLYEPDEVFDDGVAALPIETLLCQHEALQYMRQRWDKLFHEFFDTATQTFDTTKIAGMR